MSPKHSSSFGPSPAASPPTTTASADFSFRLNAVALSGANEISPGKNALLLRTTAESTPLPFGHESFAVHGPLALVGSAFYPVLVHRPADSLHASSPHAVALVQLRFASFAVTRLRRDFHPQECAHAGRTKKKDRPEAVFYSLGSKSRQAIDAFRTLVVLR